MALAGAGGFLAGVLLIAILGGAQPVYKERTLTVSQAASRAARSPRSSASASTWRSTAWRAPA